MTQLHQFVAAAVVIAVTVSSASAAYYEAPTPTPKPVSCYKDGERAIGAPGKPAVPYLPCCSGHPPKPQPGYSWGLFCGGQGEIIVTDECYKNGERAIGAPGKQYVPYLPCCSGNEPKSSPDSWGKFCVDSSGTPPAPYGEPEKTRCAGEEGYPYVKYVDCGYGNKCEKEPKYGWGFFCMPITKSDCYGPGERAIGAKGYPAIPYLPCCSGKQPVSRSYSDWGLFCPAEGVAKTPAPKPYKPVTADPAYPSAPRAYPPPPSYKPTPPPKPTKKYPMPQETPDAGYGYY